MKLITENLETSSLIVEAKDNSKKEYFIEGIFLQGDITNGNGRKYPIEVLQSAVDKYMPLIESNRALGELNHPPSPKIDYERAAIKTISLIREGSNFIGKAKLLSTPLGELCKGLIDDGVQLAVSSRGLGTIKEHNGINVVQDDYFIAAAADIVSDPSAPDAFVQGIIEGKEWVYGDGGMLIESSIDQIKMLANTNNKALQERKYQIYQNFIKMLSGKT